ncbi:aminoglycoside adenylyltransferase domain-containing protein [Paenibacillus cellulosilyticus]|uniref:aminoglycoside adenylyltransferase domain-containing protein n=1 Tax=Paenibacillus cellulosilyticus TaxID=375489 RepID=UPI000D70DDA4
MVPEEDFRSSIMSDSNYCVNALHSNPVYGVLTLSRVLSYLETGEILSKREAGLWALQNIPAELHAIVNSAVEVYEGSRTEMAVLNEEDLVQYGKRLSEMIDSHRR